MYAAQTLLTIALAAFCTTVEFVPPAPAVEPPQQSSPFRVYVQPLGPGWTGSETGAVTDAIRKTYWFEVSVLLSRDLPKEAYNAPLGRYRAERILVELAPWLPKGGLRILAVTEADISAPKNGVPDWGVMGLASYDLPVAVISSCRARRTASRPSQTLERLGKLAVHELGHTLGLPHCPSPRCDMQDACGGAARLDRSIGLCEHCRENLRSKGFLPSERKDAAQLSIPVLPAVAADPSSTNVSIVHSSTAPPRCHAPGRIPPAPDRVVALR